MTYRRKRGRFLEWEEGELLFVESYFRHRDPVRAWDEAGLGKPGMRESKRVAARNLMHRLHIREYIAEKDAEISGRLGVTIERVTTELAAIGFANMARLTVLQPDGSTVTDFSKMDFEDYASIQEIKTEVYMDRDDPDEPRPVKATTVKLAPKTPALELLGKHLKMFTDRVEVDVSVDVASKIVDARRKARAALGKR